MEHKILQQYTTADLLNFQGSNEEFNYLEQAAEKLSEQLGNENVIGYTLAAINLNVRTDNPQLAALRIMITEIWKFFGKNVGTKDAERTILRAIILDALDSLIEDDDQIAAMIWLSSQHVYCYFQITDEKEKAIIKAFIEKAGNRYEALGSSHFKVAAPASDFGISDFPEFSFPDSSRSNWAGELKSTTKIKGKVFKHYYSEDTPDGLTKTNFDIWLTNFIQKIGSTASSEKAELKKYLAKLHEDFRELYDVFATNIPVKVKGSMDVLSNHNRLIWWKETLYSKSLEKSYRAVPELVQVFAMAHDLVQEVPDYTPISVDYFLKETLIKILPENKSITIDGIAKQLIQKNNSDYLKQFLNETDLEEGQLSLLAYLKGILFEQTTKSKKAGHYMEIDNKTKITLHDLVVWLFHDFQAQKLARYEDAE